MGRRCANEVGERPPLQAHGSCLHAGNSSPAELRRAISHQEISLPRHQRTCNTQGWRGRCCAAYAARLIAQAF